MIPFNEAFNIDKDMKVSNRMMVTRKQKKRHIGSCSMGINLVTYDENVPEIILCTLKFVKRVDLMRSKKNSMLLLYLHSQHF